MSKAEEAALKAYPKLSVASVCLDGTTPVDLNTGARKRFIEGYEAAEKDLALTPDDIKLITKIHYEIVFKDTTGIKVGDVASEVLTRFKQYKEASHD